MNENPQATESDQAIRRYRGPLLDYVKTLPLKVIFEEGEISQRTEEMGYKGTKEVRPRNT